MSRTDVILSLVDPTAERAMLGAILIDPRQMMEVVALVDPRDFQSANHGTIYQAMMDLFLGGRPIDVVTLGDAIQRHTRLDDIGNGGATGSAYLTGLMTDELYTLHAEHYARQIHELAQRRQLLTRSEQVVKDACNRSIPVDDVIETGCHSLLSVNGSHLGNLAPIDNELDEFSRELEERMVKPVDVAGLPTGLIEVDDVINGLEPDRLYVFAARPGMGKTGFLLSMAYHMSILKDQHGALFSLEMGRREILLRLAARPNKVNLQDLSRGKVTKRQHQQVTAAITRLSDGRSRLWIDDTPALTPAAIRARCLHLKLGARLDYVMIDFLQLMRIPGSDGKPYVQATEAARELKNLAKALHLPVVVACQLSRKVEDRYNKIPQLGDLRDSGAIEESGDVVGALYRDDYYDPEGLDPDHDPPGIARLYILKNRSGPPGIVKLYWNADSASYWNLADRQLHL